MNATEFIKSKGEVVHAKVRFLNAGVPTMIPLNELLDEYAALRGDVPVYDIDPISGQEAKASGKPKGGKTAKNKKAAK